MVTAGLGVWRAPTAPLPPAVDHVSVALPEEVRVPTDGNAVLSPDGRHLVYVGLLGGKRQLYHRAMDEADTVPLAGTEGARSAFFSPDGEWIGFIVGSSLRKLPRAGGQWVHIADMPSQFYPFARWGPEKVCHS